MQFITGKEALKRVKNDNISALIGDLDNIKNNRIYLEPSSVKEIMDFAEMANKYSTKLNVKFVMHLGKVVSKTAATYIESSLGQLVGVNSVKELVEEGPFNIAINNGSTLGIIATGEGFNLARQIYEDSASYLKLGIINPISKNLLNEFASKHEQILVLDETLLVEKALDEMGIQYVGINDMGGLPILPEKVITAIMGEEPDYTEIADEIPQRNQVSYDE